MDFIFSEEQARLKERVRELARKEIQPLARKYGETDDVPQEIVDVMAKGGLFQLLFPVEYGGKGISAVNICIAREELAQVSAIADVTFAMQSLGGYPIVIAGTEEQKTTYIPRLARGEILTTFALTEPKAGSDVANLHTTAMPEDDSYVINGVKRFISNCYRADIGTLFAKTDPDQGNKGISAFIYHRKARGLEIVKRYRLIAPHDLAEMRFENVRIPRDRLLGEENQGFTIAMKTLDLMRMSVGACSLGIARAAFESALRFASKREQFGRPITRFQAIQLKLAEMATRIEAAAMLVYRAALLKDSGAESVTREASMAKYFATDMAGSVADEAVQIYGGLGVTDDADVERLYREARAPRIYQGTNEIQKLIIANQILKQIQ
ncbi:MAG: acyl-CoA dehydrogenase family protein [Deltaproteobacteria bacterium]|nr:acyl-CoA dehydrogenase family protein [Deltaproteobacteria bacterium]